MRLPWLLRPYASTVEGMGLISGLAPGCLALGE